MMEIVTLWTNNIVDKINRRIRYGFAKSLYSIFNIMCGQSLYTLM